MRASKGGRPAAYTDEIALAVIEAIAGGKSLKEICAESSMPSRSTVYKWLAEIPGFSDMYARAREDQADFYADEIISIADSEPDSNKARVRIDARKWAASKLRPKVYGDKLTLDGDMTVKMDDERLDARIAQLLGKAGAGEAS